MKYLFIFWVMSAEGGMLYQQTPDLNKPECETMLEDAAFEVYHNYPLTELDMGFICMGEDGSIIDSITE
jgi:hypothetical protein